MSLLNDFPPDLLPKLIEQPSPTWSGGPWKLHWKAGDRNREATTDILRGQRERERGISELGARRDLESKRVNNDDSWRGAAPQLTGKLELYILAGTARHPSTPLSGASLLNRLLLIASANNNLCVVSGQKAVSATGNIFSVCFSCS